MTIKTKKITRIKIPVCPNCGCKSVLTNYGETKCILCDYPYTERDYWHDEMSRRGSLGGRPRKSNKDGGAGANGRRL